MKSIESHNIQDEMGSTSTQHIRAQKIMKAADDLLNNYKHEKALLYLRQNVTTYPYLFELQDKLLYWWGTRGTVQTNVTNWLERDPTHPAANYMMARLLYRHGKAAEAEPLIRRALLVNAASLRGQCLLQDILSAQGKTGNDTIDIDARENPAWRAVDVSIRLSSEMDAIADIIEFSKFYPSIDWRGAAFLLLNSFPDQNWLIVVKKTLDELGEYTDGLMLIAYSCLIRGQLEETAKTIRDMLDANVFLPEQIQPLVFTLIEKGFNPEALADLSHEEIISPPSSRSALRHCQILMDNESYEDAIKLARCWFKKDPDQPAWVMKMANAYLHLGQEDKSKELLRLHVILTQEVPVTLLLYGHDNPIIYSYSSSIEEFFSNANQTTKSAENEALLRMTQGFDQVANSQNHIPAVTAESLVAASRLLLIPKERLLRIAQGAAMEVPALHAFGAANGGAARDTLKKIAGVALVNLNIALEIDPDCGEAYEVMADTYDGIGMVAEAESCRREAVRLGVENNLAFARNLLDVGQLEEAKVHIAEGLELIDNDLVVYSGLSFSDWCAEQGANIKKIDSEPPLESSISVMIDGDIRLLTAPVSASPIEFAEVSGLILYSGYIPINQKAQYPTDAIYPHSTRSIPGLHLIGKNSIITDSIDKTHFIDETVVVLGGIKAHYRNYFHTLYQNILRIPLLLQTEEFANLRFAVPSDITPWAINLMELSGLKRERLIILPVDHHTRLRKAIILNPIRDNSVASVNQMRAFKDSVLDKQPQKKGGLRLFLSRPGTKLGWRVLVNEKALIKIAKSYGFLIVDPGSMSIPEQVDLFSRADIICGATGSALTNALFAPSGATVINLSPRQTCRSHYVGLVTQGGQKFIWCLGSFLPEVKSSKQFPHLPYHVDEEYFRKLLDEVTPPSLLNMIKRSIWRLKFKAN